MNVKINKTYTIVLVDDEPQILNALQRELRDCCNENPIELFAASSAEECLNYLKVNHNRVFLVISDLRMTGMPGSDLLLEVRKKFPDIILILLTAYSDMPEIQKAVSAAILSLVLKPWDYEALISEVKRAWEIYHIKRNNKLFQKEINYQLEAASDFQRKMLSVKIPRMNKVDIKMKYVPLSNMRCGGDFYDFIELDHGRCLVFIGDVAGHGIRPAFITGMLKVLTREMDLRRPNRPVSSAKVLSHLNKGLIDTLENVSDIVVTFMAMIIDPKFGQISVANAGHLPLYIVRNGECVPFTTGGPALGFIDPVEYEESVMEIGKGDKIIMFTDGLVESPAGKKKIEENFTMKNLLEVSDSRDIPDTLFNKMMEFHPENQYSDDVTIISFSMI